MKILVDVNLSPQWADYFRRERIESVHWSAVGDPRAADTTIMDWARRHGYVVFTHDLDFGTLLALNREVGPSVIQVRTQDITPQSLGAVVVSTISQHEDLLAKGALIVVDDTRTRARVLPLHGSEE